MTNTNNDYGKTEYNCLHVSTPELLTQYITRDQRGLRSGVRRRMLDRETVRGVNSIHCRLVGHTPQDQGVGRASAHLVGHQVLQWYRAHTARQVILLGCSPPTPVWDIPALVALPSNARRGPTARAYGRIGLDTPSAHAGGGLRLVVGELASSVVSRSAVVALTSPTQSYISAKGGNGRVNVRNNSTCLHFEVWFSFQRVDTTDRAMP